MTVYVRWHRVALEDSLYTGEIPDDDVLHAELYCGCPEEGPAVCDFSSDPTIENCVQVRVRESLHIVLICA